MKDIFSFPEINWVKHILILLLATNVGFSRAEEENENLGKPTLKSIVSRLSAEVYREEKQNDEKAIEADEKRTILGIGESINISITGKKMLIGKTSEIRWNVKEGEEFLVEFDKNNLKGQSNINILISNKLTKEQLAGKKLIIEATLENEEFNPEPINFEIVFPKAILAAHIPNPPKMGSYVDGSKYPKFMGAPKDGSLNPGASALLKLTLQPTSVSFSGLNIIEKDKGTLSEGCSLATGHNADSVWEVTGNHDFHEPDAIGRWLSLENMKKIDEFGESVHKLPQSWAWSCDFCIYNKEDEAEGALIQNVQQKFQVNSERGGAGEELYRFNVSKFNCSVTRLTGGEHEFHKDKN